MRVCRSGDTALPTMSCSHKVNYNHCVTHKLNSCVVWCMCLSVASVCLDRVNAGSNAVTPIPTWNTVFDSSSPVNHVNSPTSSLAPLEEASSVSAHLCSAGMTLTPSLTQSITSSRNQLLSHPLTQSLTHATGTIQSSNQSLMYYTGCSLAHSIATLLNSSSALWLWSQLSFRLTTVPCCGVNGRNWLSMTSCWSSRISTIGLTVPWARARFILSQVERSAAVTSKKCRQSALERSICLSY